MTKALYRVLRPKNWSDVIDKDLIVEILQNQVKNNTTSHGYLFCGMRGTGKTSCAKILARAVNCLNPHDGEPCNECKNCVEILNDRAVDVLELDAASNNGVDNIRELKELGVYPPTSLKKKVYIIDEAHMLSNSAFNALLKILEEPPEHLIFILATTEPDKIPDTVKSRLQRFDFHGIRRDAIEDNLKKISNDLNEEITDGVFEIISENAGGSMRDALSMLDQLLSIPNRPITEEIVTGLLGITGAGEVGELLKYIFSYDSLNVLNECESLTKKGRSEEKLLYVLMKACRDLYEYKLVGVDSSIRLPGEIKNLSDIVESSRLLDLIEGFRKILNEINYAFDESLLFQLGLLELSRNKKDTVVVPRKEVLSLEKLLKNAASFSATSVNSSSDLKSDDSKGEFICSEVKDDSIKADAKKNLDKSHDFNEAEVYGEDCDDKSEELNEADETNSNSSLLAGDKEESKDEPKEAQEEVEGEPQEEHKEVIEDDDSILENEEGKKLFDDIIHLRPILVVTKDDLHLKLEGNKFTITPKSTAINNDVFFKNKDNIVKHTKEILGPDAVVDIKEVDPKMRLLKDFFGDKLEIKRN